MKAAQPHRSEVHIPQPVVNFFKANLELGEQVTHVHPARVPADPPVAADEATLVMARIEQRREPHPVRQRGGRIAARRRRVAERFVWALGVVALAEVIEAALLRREVRLWWAGR